MMDSEELSKWAQVVFIVGASLTLPFLVLDILWSSDVINKYPLAVEYYPAFIATTMGVFIALLVEELLTSSRQEKRMQAIQGILRNELKRMQEIVSRQKGNHIDTQVWDSLINSGHASLLPTNLQEELFEIYARAKALNADTTRARDTAETQQKTPSEDTERPHFEISGRISKKEQELGKILEEFLASDKLEDSKEHQ